MSTWQEIDWPELESKARLWQARGEKWHFHMLTPDCSFNKVHDKHAFLLENTSTNEIDVVYSSRSHLEMGKLLVKLLHGEQILKEARSEASQHPDFLKILARAKSLSAEHKHWHHHMFFPECCLNPKPGKWNICLEDDGKLLQALYEEEPSADLRQLEALYYSQCV